MTTVVEESIVVSSGVDDVWRIVRAVDQLDWVPNIGSVSLEGDIRVIDFADGSGQARERIDLVDDEAHTCAYSYVSGAIPLDASEAVISVHPEGAGTRIRWKATLTATAMDEADVADIVADMFAGALSALSEKLTAEY